MENRKRYLITYLVLTILLAALLLLNIRSGSVELTGRQVLAALSATLPTVPFSGKSGCPEPSPPPCWGER